MLKWLKYCPSYCRTRRHVQLPGLSRWTLTLLIVDTIVASSSASIKSDAIKVRSLHPCTSLGISYLLPFWSQHIEAFVRDDHRGVRFLEVGLIKCLSRFDGTDRGVPACGFLGIGGLVSVFVAVSGITLTLQALPTPVPETAHQTDGVETENDYNRDANRSRPMESSASLSEGCVREKYNDVEMARRVCGTGSHSFLVSRAVKLSSSDSHC